MSYTERTYIQNANGCVRNQDLLNIRMTSDWCEFTPPVVEMTGTSKIQSVGATSEGVYLITGQTGMTIGLIFSGGPGEYSGSSVDTIIEVYPYDTVISGFTNPYIYKASAISLSGDVVSSAYTVNLPVSDVYPDNEYLIKTYFEFDACTEFLNILGVRYDNRLLLGDDYYLYNEDFDNYISVSYPADVPILGVSSGGTDTLFGGLIAYSQFPVLSGQTDFLLQHYVGDVMVNLNGVTLAPNYDFTMSGGVVTISAGTELTDVLTFIHSVGSDDFIGLNGDYIVVSVINSGTTGGQGSDDVYYNISEDKYEVYTSLSIPKGSDVVMTLNGVTLANNIDYYKSVSNDKRIILEGVIMAGDVINLYYFTNVTYIGQIYTNTPSVTWSIEHAPTLVNGQFTLELSTGVTFNNIIYSALTDYNIGINRYGDTLVVSGAVGTEYYYRVKNEKFYQPITGDTIDTVAYSELVPIIIQSNAINSY